MKRPYTKPELFCEEYVLSVSIAGNCGSEFPAYNVTHSDYLSCGYKMGKGMLFVDTNSVCTTKPSGVETDSFCYQVPNDSSRAFSS